MATDLSHLDDHTRHLIKTGAATDLTAIRRWYSGKALAVVEQYVLPMLALAEEQGFWPKGASRKVKAALNKQTVAIKFARANERNRDDRRGYDDSKLEGLLDDVSDDRKHYFNAKLSGHRIVHAMMFGQFHYARQAVELALDLKAQRCVRTPAEQEALQTAMQWAIDFRPVADLVAKLDATRPKIVLVMGSLSRAVVANLGKLMGLALDDIKPAPVEGKWIEVTNDKGQVERYWVVEVVWPAGTRHYTSKFAFGSKAGNEQCHACGHAIKDPWNWVPLLGVNREEGAYPVSLWVGRDCARKLFSVVVTGDAQYTNRTEGRLA